MFQIRGTHYFFSNKADAKITLFLPRIRITRAILKLLEVRESAAY